MKSKLVKIWEYIGARIFGTEHTLLSFEGIKASYLDTAKTLSYELLCSTSRLDINVNPFRHNTLFYVESNFNIFRQTQN